MSENTTPATTKDNSGKLFDTIIWDRRLKSDAALGRLLNLAPPVVSKIRHGRITLSDAVILRVHEATDMPVKQIRQLIATEA